MVRYATRWIGSLNTLHSNFMKKREIPLILADLKSIVNELESTLSGSHLSPPVGSAVPVPSSQGYSGPTGGIKMLHDQEFFKQPKTLGSVLAELRKEGYNYRREVVSTSLIRLVRQRTLTRIPSQGGESRERWQYCERK